mmetsp:Transcript_7297/g.17794  ORF Transcript_7297/g.17794 Transcript_7297/m.17794 type:complete len:194 (-) Transcript_7297:336-917(-)
MEDQNFISRRKNRIMPNHNTQPSKRRRLSTTGGIISLLEPARSPQSFVLPKCRASRPQGTFANQQEQPLTIPRGKNLKEEDDAPDAIRAPTKSLTSLPKLKDSALTSENIESALCLIDKNAKRKQDSYEELLQAFHDLYRWSRLPNSDHRKFFLNEFVWELSGISRVMKFLRAHDMGDVFLCQLLQTELPFNE